MDNLTKLAIAYDPAICDIKWQRAWERDGIYKWDKTEPRENQFSIDTPPPTVSGLLHMGHIFSYAHTDFYARYHRMCGKSVFYPIGFDDNGLPTERFVEKIKQIRASDLPRNEFVTICRESVIEAETAFRTLFKSISFSFDWDQEYQTISDKSRAISQMSFLDLYHSGHITRSHGPVYWDPVDKTAVAQTEIEDMEKIGVMNDIEFKTTYGEKIVIGTTRPELLPACGAVLYNPHDPRYVHFAKNPQIKAIVPIFEKIVPIIGDHDVSIEKGTGLVMCCTFGDIQDITWWRKYGLPLTSCLTLDGRMENAGELMTGFKVKDARVKIVGRLKEMGLLLKQTEVRQVLKCAERSRSPVEIISTSQWYVNVLNKKAHLLHKACECKWFPASMRIRLENWINGLNQEWCISRQRYFGVPFPVWYSKRITEKGKIILPPIDQLPVDPTIDLPNGYTRDEVIPDEDIMDTWATSSLTPQLSTWKIANQYKLDKDRHAQLFPFDLRPQSHEIIRTWTFGTMVKALLHEDSVPWKNVVISGWCLAEDKTKMSKSKGNVTTPQDLISRHGADVVRYWASSAALGTDVVYSEEGFKIGKRLLNKLWNVARFCEPHFESIELWNATALSAHEVGQIFHVSDLWILSKIQYLIKFVTDRMTDFDYHGARIAIEELFWKDFCDNYIELIKYRIYNAQHQKHDADSGVLTLYFSLYAILAILAPFMPHVTEEIYQSLIFPIKNFGKENPPPTYLNQRGTWPKETDFLYNLSALREGETMIKFLELARKFKSEHELSQGANIDIAIIITQMELSFSARQDLQHTIKARNIYFEHTERTDTSLCDLRRKHKDEYGSLTLVQSGDGKYGMYIGLKNS